jgi:hypothetical protein
LRAGPLYASGVAALLCAGLTIGQTSALYGDSFGDRTAWWSIASPLIAIASLGYLTRAIHGLATRRGFHDLRMRSSGTGGFACVLLLVSFVITAVLSSGVRSEDMMVFLMVAALFGGLFGTMMLATLCTAAADAVRDSSPTLPTARAI